MAFNSILSIFYFLPLFFLAYYFVDKRFKNTIIVAGSLLFCAWGAPRFIFVILGAALVDFYLVKLMAASQSKKRRRSLLGLTLFLNIGLFCYFKYSAPFVAGINQLFHTTYKDPVAWTKIIFPVGLSWFTFGAVTYIADVYRGVCKPARQFADYLLYVLFFPKFLAGPVIPYHDFESQVAAHTEALTIDNKLAGLYRFFIGLAKKVFIANVLGTATDAIFALPPATLGTSTAWFGAVSYTFQVYFDFSAYTDMAIGLAAMMGFQLPENFNNPYTALSLTDFWQRWHMSFVNWIRDYVYNPGGDNAGKSKTRVFINLLFVFLVLGIWHGASWGFVIWGFYNGLFLVMERLFLGKWLAKTGKGAVIYTFIIASIGWVFFRAEHFDRACLYLTHMFSWHPDYDAWYRDGEFTATLIAAGFFSFFAITRWGQNVQQQVLSASHSVKWHLLAAFILIIVFIISAARMASVPFNDFIYSGF